MGILTAILLSVILVAPVHALPITTGHVATDGTVNFAGDEFSIATVIDPFPLLVRPMRVALWHPIDNIGSTTYYGDPRAINGGYIQLETHSDTFTAFAVVRVGDVSLHLDGDGYVVRSGSRADFIFGAPAFAAITAVPESATLPMVVMSACYLAACAVVLRRRVT